MYLTYHTMVAKSRKITVTSIVPRSLSQIIKPTGCSLSFPSFPGFHTLAPHDSLFALVALVSWMMTNVATSQRHNFPRNRKGLHDMMDRFGRNDGRAELLRLYSSERHRSLGHMAEHDLSRELKLEGFDQNDEHCRITIDILA